MSDEIRREIRRLKVYALVMTALFATMTLAAFTQGAQKQRFTEIDVERINIVEPDGAYRMVLSNRPRSIGPIYKGKPFGYPGGGRPGIIFFNDEGTENGGLTFTGKKNADGTWSASSGFSFDQFNQDQILYFQYAEENGRRRTGFTIADRADVDIYDMIQERDSIMKLPEGQVRNDALQKWQQPRNGVPLFATRLYVGRTVQKASVVNLADPQGRTRLLLKVDSLGVASIEFMDESGKVTGRFPAAQ
jgi:hypothetical protein